MKAKLTIFVISLLISFSAGSQCAMCRAVLESEESQSAAEGINDGIVFLMAVPYILVGAVGYFIYRTFNKSRKATNP
jgi:hypothetical protein